MRFDACYYVFSSLCNLGKCVRGLLASLGLEGPRPYKPSFDALAQLPKIQA